MYYSLFDFEPTPKDPIAWLLFFVIILTIVISIWVQHQKQLAITRKAHQEAAVQIVDQAIYSNWRVNQVHEFNAIIEAKVQLHDHPNPFVQQEIRKRLRGWHHQHHPSGWPERMQGQHTSGMPKPTI